MEIKDILGSLIRGSVQAGAGVLVSKGVLDAATVGSFVDSTTALIVGGIVFLGTLVWSLISKKKALDTPVPVK